MTVQFPTAPTHGDEYQDASRIWRWNVGTTRWELVGPRQHALWAPNLAYAPDAFVYTTDPDDIGDGARGWFYLWKNATNDYIASSPTFEKSDWTLISAPPEADTQYRILPHDAAKAYKQYAEETMSMGPYIVEGKVDVESGNNIVVEKLSLVSAKDILSSTQKDSVENNYYGDIEKVEEEEPELLASL